MDSKRDLSIGIIMFPGSNCAEDMKRYFPNSFYIWHLEDTWRPMDLLVIPGGFAFGDRDYQSATGKYVINPGRKAKDSPVKNIIYMAVKKKIPILGVCNGFQILTQMGLLPGKLELNNNNKFTCKNVECKIDNHFLMYEQLNEKGEIVRVIQGNDIVNLEVANSYGRYMVSKSLSQELKDNNQVFLTYNDDYKDKNGSICNIAGVCDKDHLIFGMMPHPERTNCQLIQNIILDQIRVNNHRKLDVLRNKFNYEVKNLMNSEHISYKSTRKLLKNLYTEGSNVIQGPGENAGLVDIGDGYAIAIRVESHNHPTFIDPYNGAATGVGGIIRDIFTMGARPIALLDFLRFGHDDHSYELLQEAVRGIAEYGNCIGIANVGGDCYLEDIYSKNPLVNVACLGIVKKDDIVYGNVKEEGDLLIYVGSRTGNDGINGAAMASEEFSSDSNMEELKSNIQKGDAFLEKLLLEACLEIVNEGLLQGMQDMGAGGLLCSSVEVVQRGRNKFGHNFGCVINVDNIPEKLEMDSCDKLISESQERMLLVVKPENKNRIFEIFDKWDLEYEVVGNVNLSGKYEVVNGNNEILFSENMTDFDDPTEQWSLEPSNGIISKSNRICVQDTDLWTNYDKSIGCRTLELGRGAKKYSILDIHENGKKLIITWGETFKECYDNINRLGGKSLGLVNCLNYGHPKDSLGDMAKFLENLTQDCEEYGVPVLGGNVSLYNATDNISIRPTPILVMIGLI
jgi:phosphoribosylformylglycinamidine synthase subunit PurL